ncbi:zinc-specific metallo-regulatory protein [Desulfosporosinus acididurans]|uniref:Zinc-specific metallo-regulatory protein n=1 Tax=Desulfosporosinus acididurans TaxID=476652 RepID=A0A0J1FX54_9FIRM|nr:Fur family transcriptional regulator [Desulfosporosinus acididurans]KLU67892.1 zinc-specific metallo-regulatory protein [Desulfosporosinus acididurans]
MNYGEILEYIQQQGYRLTSARKHIVEVLCHNSDYLGAYDIHHILEENNKHIAVVSIYRVLEMLNSIGLLEKEEFGSGGERYCLKNAAEQHGHQLICTKCGQSKELGDCPIRHLAQSIEAQSGYRIQNHWLRFFGLCPHCQSEEDLKPPQSIL